MLPNVRIGADFQCASSGLDYTKNDTPHSEWESHLAYKVLTKSPKWQGVDGPVMDLECGSLGLSGVVTSRNGLQVADDDGGYTGPPGSKKAKRARKDADAISSAMLAVAKSMALSAESVGRNAAAQTERNGIMLFVGKLDQADEDAREYMKFKTMIHLKNARIEASAAAPDPASETAMLPPGSPSPATPTGPTGTGVMDVGIAN
jgi:hypothetical protein